MGQADQFGCKGDIGEKGAKLKTLYLWRHAKSDWGNMDLEDHDRALNKRGNKDAPRMAETMKAHEFVPQQIFCSSARRTRQTLALFQSIMGDEIPCAIDRSLYLASPQVLLDRIQRAKEPLGSILIISHNPGIEDLSAELCDPKGKTTPNFPTAALATFEFDVENWKDVKLGTGRLLNFLTPKTLAA